MNEFNGMHRFWQKPKTIRPQVLDFSNVTEGANIDGEDEPFPEYFIQELGISPSKQILRLCFN